MENLIGDGKWSPHLRALFISSHMLKLIFYSCQIFAIKTLVFFLFSILAVVFLFNQQNDIVCLPDNV